MTTITLPAIYFNFRASDDALTSASTSRVQLQLPARGATFSYKNLPGAPDDDWPDVEITAPTGLRVLNNAGVALNFAASDAYIGEYTWRGQTTQFLMLEFPGAASYSGIFMRLGGAALPQVGSVAQANAFLGAITYMGRLSDGKFAAGRGIRMDDLPGALVTENDRISGSATADRLAGGIGNDTLSGLAGNDTLNGDQGRDLLNGGAGNDQLNGGTGNDTLYGGSGNDRLSGEADNDVIYGGEGADTAYGGNGNDRILGEAGNDLFYGGTGADTLYGASGNDRLFAEAGNDQAYGGSGNDTIQGGNGLDRLFGDDGNDLIYGGSDADTIQGGRGNDRLYGDAGADLIQGGAGHDTLYGGTAKDTLSGGEGNDRLFGGDGNDRLAGDAGNDTLTGGPGQDVFVFAVDGAARGRFGNDVITDFSAGDTIGLRGRGLTLGDSVTMRDTTQGLLIETGAGSILLQGVTRSGFDTDALLL